MTSAASAATLFNVRDRVTVVTGGASGIGRAFAEVMAENGALVVIADIDADAARQVTAELGKSGSKVFAEQVDASDKASLEGLFSRVAAQHGPVKIFFANVGISGGPGFLNSKKEFDPKTALEVIPQDLWERVLKTNVSSIFYSLQVAAAHMKAHGGGKIIITSSCSASKTELYVGSAYVTSKAAVAHLVRQSAIELAHYGIQVNAIAPGPTATNIGGGRMKLDENRTFFAQYFPMGRIGSPDDLKGAALFLASPASDFMTGSHVAVDGGFALGFLT